MTAVIVAPARMHFSPEQPIVDLSAEAIQGAISRCSQESEGSDVTLERDGGTHFEMLTMLVPANSFTPFRIDFGDQPDDDLFGTLMQLSKFNEMIGGNGVTIITEDEAADADSSPAVTKV